MILTGDALKILPTLDTNLVQCCVTSPPYYGLRDYGCEGQIGLEATPEEYVAKLVAVFREVRRVLRDDGTLWLNLGDSYASDTKGQNNNGEGGSTLTSGARPHVRAAYNNGRGREAHRVDCGLKAKNLLGIPWRVAFALQADGWYLRSEIIWHKPNPMPESVTDRPTKSHEQIFLLSKQAKYFYDAEAVKEPFADERMGNPGPSKQVYANDPLTGRGIRGQGGPSTKLQEIGWNVDGKNTGRNRRSVWTITTKPLKLAHFATFPPEIPEICIKAGTSEKGCCPECGSPWERMVEKEKTPRGDAFGKKDIGQYDHGQAGKPYLETIRCATIGWRPTCSHDLNPIPCVVMDPFSGAGTVGMVAEKLGRKHIGIELNPAYAKMGEERTEAARLPLFMEA